MTLKEKKVMAGKRRRGENLINDVILWEKLKYHSVLLNDSLQEKIRFKAI